MVGGSKKGLSLSRSLVLTEGVQQLNLFSILKAWSVSQKVVKSCHVATNGEHYNLFSWVTLTNQIKILR